MTRADEPLHQDPSNARHGAGSVPRLEAFRLRPNAPELVACTGRRAWMDAFPDRHAYRCVPMTVANTHGWELLVPASFEVEWNGGSRPSDLVVRALDPLPPGHDLDTFVRSHFSSGILTFDTGYVFRTPPGWNLLATGAFNEPRPGAYALTGIVETDWLPYPFTMNWQVTRAGKLRFLKDEVFCTVVPVPKSYLEHWEVAVHDLADDPVLERQVAQFGTDRVAWSQQAAASGTDDTSVRCQRHYFSGRMPDGTTVRDHAVTLRLKAPMDCTGTKPALAKSDE